MEIPISTYLLFPAAPPWLAAERGYISPPFARVSSHVYAEMDLAGAPTLWSQTSPNPVAAVPSLHAAWATLAVVLVLMMFGLRWFLISLPYPLVIFVGTVYSGEHYVIDEILGVLYALGSLLVVQLLWSRSRRSRAS